jgi:hypothetical protein
MTKSKKKQLIASSNRFNNWGDRLCYVVLAFLALEVIQEFTTKRGNELGLVIWLFIYPALGLLLVAAFVLYVNAYRLTSDESKIRKGAMLILLPIGITFLAMPTIMKAADTYRNKPTAGEVAFSKRAAEEVRKADADSKIISYNNTHIVAYQLRYLPSGYHSDSHEFSRTGSNIHTWVRDADNKLAFSFGSFSDTAPIDTRLLYSKKVIGITKWGANIIFVAYTPNQYAYMADYRGEHLIFQFGDYVPTDRTSIEPEVINMYNSIERAN